MGPHFSRRESSHPRRTVATFSRYDDAESAVDFLSDRQFPVEHTAIVARDLEYVEQVTGRMTYGRAALTGALNGAMVGVLIGWLFAVFNWFDPVVSSLWLVIDGLWFGALIGATMAMLFHALSGGRRDFSAIGGMLAKSYEVVVDEEFADEAERLLGKRAVPAARPVSGSAPASPSEH